MGYTAEVRTEKLKALLIQADRAYEQLQYHPLQYHPDTDAYSGILSIKASIHT